MCHNNADLKCISTVEEGVYCCWLVEVILMLAAGRSFVAGGCLLLQGGWGLLLFISTTKLYLVLNSLKRAVLEGG